MWYGINYPLAQWIHFKSYENRLLINVVPNKSRAICESEFGQSGLHND